MTKEQRLKKRYRAEKRFKMYGLISVSLAVIFVLILVQNIFSKGSSAFSRTMIEVAVNYDSSLLELEGPINQNSLKDADFYDLAVESLLKIYPAKDSKEERQILRLFSPDYEFEIKDFLIKNPNKIDQIVPVIYDNLIEKEKIDKKFNNYLFTKGDSRDPELAGIGGSLMGSFFTIIICLILSFPIAIMASIYLEEFAPKNKITDFIEININNLAAVPSIVYGLLGLGILLSVMEFPRSTPLVAGITLSLMTLPRIIIPCRASLKAVPPSIREAALSVGASKFQTVFHHVVPLAMPGTLSGTIIGLAQALGETAPLILIGMVAFVVDIPSSPVDPSASLPVQVYLWSEQAERGFVEKTSATIMMLLGFLIVMNFIAVYLRQKFEKKWN